jgi:cyclopropane fatty-acyl-phospholipid synthase-like methyltransferase
MLEVLVLLAIVLLIPFLGATPFQIILIMGAWAVLSMPGAWLMFRGAAPLVPTPASRVRKMMEFAELKPGQIAYDLGCGDGRIVFAAAGRGARAIGYEYSVLAYFLAKLRSLSHRGASIRYGNFWRKDLRDADVIFCYLLTQTMPAFHERIWASLKPGARVVSHTFRLPGESAVKSEEGVHLYIR